MYPEGMEVLTFEEDLEAEGIRYNAMYRSVNSVKKSPELLLRAF